MMDFLQTATQNPSDDSQRRNEYSAGGQRRNGTSYTLIKREMEIVSML